jgi:eukaryotic-like serine/threonine-protein kinase
MVSAASRAGNECVMAQPPPPAPDDRAAVEEVDVVDEVDPAYPRRRVVVEEPPPPPRRDIWGWLVAALMAAAAIAFLVLWLNERESAAETSEAPNLVGLSQQEAQNRALSSGFELGIVRRASESRAGSVLEQAPRAGEQLEDGGRMMAVVSSGRREVSVPELVGLSRPAAQRLADQAQLTLVQKAVASEKQAGTIVAQAPRAGEQVVVGSSVNVNVSRGPSLVSVPSLRGVSLDQAIEALTTAGLVPRVIRVPSAAAEDTVILQDPSAGQRVQPGSTVRLNVSAGTTATVQETVTVTSATTETVATTVPTP